jgi:hypothetical protein
MANSKYELRSSDAQEIMRKPPRAFIARGNILILSALLVAFYFLNTIPLYKKEAIHCEIAHTNEIINRDDSSIIALSLKVNIPENVKRNQPARLFINNIKVTKDSFLMGRIDSIGYSPSEGPMLFFKCGREGLIVQAGNIGNIEIILKKETLLSMLLDRFRF